VVDWMVVFPAATAVLGLWVALSGRTLRGRPRWPLDGHALRLVAAFDFLASLAVVVLALRHEDGIAFLTYGLSALILVAAVQLAVRRKSAI
jgi:hypothetical protein